VRAVELVREMGLPWSKAEARKASASAFRKAWLPDRGGGGTIREGRFLGRRSGVGRCGGWLGGGLG
jgi:hypothetical protein